MVSLAASNRPLHQVLVQTQNLLLSSEGLIVLVIF